MWHTATALSLGPGRTQVTMFGGCPKWEREKSDDAQQKLAKTTVLEFGEQNTHNSIHSLVDSMFCLAMINYSYQTELKNPLLLYTKWQTEGSQCHVCVPFLPLFMCSSFAYSKQLPSPLKDHSKDYTHSLLQALL